MPIKTLSVPAPSERQLVFAAALPDLDWDFDGAHGVLSTTVRNISSGGPSGSVDIRVHRSTILPVGISLYAYIYTADPAYMAQVAQAFAERLPEILAMILPPESQEKAPAGATAEAR